MKQLTLFLILIFNTSSFFAQGEEIGTKQFMLGCTNVGSSEQVTHYIEAIGSAWEYSSGSFVISSNQNIYNNSLITIGNANFSSTDWPGFNFSWLDVGYEMPRWGLGVYKVTNSKQTDKYFYLDSRDSDFGTAAYNPDFYIYFDNSFGAYRYRSNNEAIPQGEVVRVWDIHEESPNTSGLQNYWINVLVAVKSGSNHPLVVWGPYPTDEYLTEVTYFEIWRKIGSLNWNYLGYVNGSTYLYEDEELVVAGQQSGTTVLYKVRAVQTAIPDNILSDYTNTASIVVQGEDPGKIKAANYNGNNNVNNFELFQNYPNPFNPSTIINYTLPEEANVQIKVYDMLGTEIAELVNETRAAGFYETTFDASNLSSGVYIYRITALNGERILFAQSKQMILIK